MASKNQKSSTLPPGIKYNVPQQDEGKEGFLSKMWKKLRTKKGKYSVDVNTGDCDNVTSVSFKKRESSELGDGPLKFHEHGNSTRETRSHSPKLGKHATRTHSDRALGPKPGKSKHQRKHSFPEAQLFSLRSSHESNSAGQLAQVKTRVGNEYSRLDYENKDISTERPRLSKGNAVVNDHIVQDDESAIDLDNMELDIPKTDKKFVIDPGKTKDRSDSEPLLTDPQKSPDWDPRYESLDDVKQKLKEQYQGGNKTYHHKTEKQTDLEYDPQYQSVSEAKAGDIDDAIDPGYQSVNDVKKQMAANFDKKAPKTYSVHQSIESLDEPGYECLNDVKKRINEQRGKENSRSREKVSDSGAEISKKVEKLSLENLSGSRCSERRHSGTPDSKSGVIGLTETALSLTEIATALTGSGMSKDSGFQSKDRSVDSEMDGK